MSKRRWMPNIRAALNRPPFIPQPRGRRDVTSGNGFAWAETCQRDTNKESTIRAIRTRATVLVN